MESDRNLLRVCLDALNDIPQSHRTALKHTSLILCGLALIGWLLHKYGIVVLVIVIALGIVALIYFLCLVSAWDRGEE